MRYLAALLVATANAADVCGNTQAIDGQQFPDWIKSGGSTRQLTGGGTRYKYGVAKVYALGLYIDEGTTTGALSKFAGKEGKQLAADQKFHDAVITGKFGKTMLLQFHRAVGGELLAFFAGIFAEGASCNAFVDVQTERVDLRDSVLVPRAAAR